MKILHIAECAGGVERYLQMLLPRLEKKGMKQYFICSRNYDESLYCKIVDGVQQMDLTQSFSPLRVIKKVRAIRREIKKVNPDILYCHSSFAGGLGRMAAIGLHCKVVYNPHGWGPNATFFVTLTMRTLQISPAAVRGTNTARPSIFAKPVPSAV